MTKNKPTYDELKEKLAKTEEHLARVQKSEINPIKSELDTAILSTKELAEAYLASEQNFKNSVDTCPLGIRIVTEDGELIYANKAALNIFGFNTVEELAAMKRQELFTPESYAAHQERKKKRKLKQYVPGEYELSIRRPDGEVRNLMVFRREVMWGGEKQYMAMYEDITERKRAEEALNKEQAFLSNVLASIKEGLTILDNEFNIIMVTESTEKQFAHAMPLVGKKCYEALHSLSEPCEACPTKKTLQTGKATCDVTRRHGPGGVFIGWIELYSFPLLDNETGKITGVIEHARDITERKMAEEALRESEEKYHSLVEHSNDGIVFIEDGLINYCNSKMLEIGGYTQEDLIGKPFVDFIAPEQRENAAEIYKKRIAGLPVPERYELDIVSKDGNIVHTEVSASLFYLRQKPVDIVIIRDITDRKKMDEAFRQSEELFAKAFRSSPDAVTISTLDEGIIIDMNDAALKDTGYSINELVGHSIYDSSPWVKQEDHERILQVLKNNGSISQEEYQFRTKSGEIRTCELSAEPIVIGGRNCIISVQRDITDRKQAEEALRESEEKYKTILETALDGFWVVNDKGKILEVNDSLCEMLGYTREELLNMTIRDIEASESPEETHRRVEKIIREGSDRFETRHRRKDGRIIDVDASVIHHAIAPGQAFAFFHDITKRKMSEEALKESEEKYRLLFENSKDAILLTSPDGQILRANPEACRMFGRTEEEILRGGRQSLLDASDPRLEQALEKRRSTGEFSGELTGIRADGTRFPIDVSSRIFYDREEKARTSMIIRDISERKRMEEQLEADSEEIKLIIDSTPVLVFYKDLEGKFLRVNMAFASALNMTEEDMVGKTVFDLYSKDIAQGMTDDDQEVYKSRAPKLNIIEQYESAVGLRWVQTDKIPIFDKDKKVIGLVGFAQDITERKKAEEALKESEERFNKAFHASPNMMSVITLEDGRFIDVNEEHTRITGYERRETIGKTALELNLWVHPEKRAEFYSIINAEGRLKDYEVLLRTKSGEIKTMLFSAEKITLRGINCLVVSEMDITERKEAEERINHLNLTLRSIRNVSEVITREKDRSLLIQKVCESLAESRSFVGVWIVLLDEKQQLITWAEANTSKDFPALIEQIKQNNTPQCVTRALKQRQVVVTEDYAICKGCPVHTPDFNIGSMSIRLELEGKIYGVLCAAIPQKKLLHDKEEIALFSEIASDISFALYNIELVAASELRQQESLRMAKMESIGMLAGGIAHDFNNLLTGIMGNIGLVKTYISTSDPTYEMLDEAEIAAVRARDLTQQLLTFAKGGKPVKKLANPAEIIRESAEFALRGSNDKLEISFPNDLRPIEADEGQISQVINNIVINADEAMPAGGTLKITAENLVMKKSDALPVRSGNYIRIDIKDTGTGMSPAHLQRIFEPYFTTKQKGSGLGLTTAYSVVKNHGGIITVESVLNEGTTFRIYLPATKKALKGARKLTVEEPGQAGGKVLIMDDEEIIRKMLKNMLGMAGYTIELSADGVEALEKYKQAKEARDPFNAVIMDLTIPGGMGGREAVKKLLEIDPKATVIVSSGYATDPIMSDYKRYGFKAVIAKPYSVRQLRELLSRLLAKKKR